jgi:hypothetical protein
MPEKSKELTEKATMEQKKPKNKAASKASTTPNTRGYKVSHAVIQSILDLTILGLSNTEIIQFLVEKHGISLHVNMLSYYRRKYKDKLLAAQEDQILAARANYPEGAMLSGRIGKLERACEREFKKKRMSGTTIAQLVQAENQAMYQAEMMRLRLRELAAKFPERKDDEKEQVLRELERRAHAYDEEKKETDEMAEIAGWDIKSNSNHAA